MGYWNYFPKPHVSVREDGSFSLEWITKDDDRLSINFDDPKDCAEGEHNVYAIYTAWDNKELKTIKQELISLHGTADVLRALALLGLKPE
jgi:hypothetical protein